MGGPLCFEELGQVCKIQREEATGMVEGILREGGFDQLHPRDRTLEAVMQQYYLMLLGSRMRHDGKVMTWK